MVVSWRWAGGTPVISIIQSESMKDVQHLLGEDPGPLRRTLGHRDRYTRPLPSPTARIPLERDEQRESWSWYY